MSPENEPASPIRADRLRAFVETIADDQPAVWQDLWAGRGLAAVARLDHAVAWAATWHVADPARPTVGWARWGAAVLAAADPPDPPTLDRAWLLSAFVVCAAQDRGMTPPDPASPLPGFVFDPARSPQPSRWRWGDHAALPTGRRQGGTGWTWDPQVETWGEFAAALDGAYRAAKDAYRRQILARVPEAAAMPKRVTDDYYALLCYQIYGDTLATVAADQDRDSDSVWRALQRLAPAVGVPLRPRGVLPPEPPRSPDTPITGARVSGPARLEAHGRVYDRGGGDETQWNRC